MLAYIARARICGLSVCTCTYVASRCWKLEKCEEWIGFLQLLRHLPCRKCNEVRGSEVWDSGPFWKHRISLSTCRMDWNEWWYASKWVVMTSEIASDVAILQNSFVSQRFTTFGLFGRSDEYGEGPKGPASTGEEAEMGFEVRKVWDKSRAVYRYRTHTAWYATSSQSPFKSMWYPRLASNDGSCFELFWGSYSLTDLAVA